MVGKCNCGKKATYEYLTHSKRAVASLKFCNKCRPKQLNTWGTIGMQLIDGKV